MVSYIHADTGKKATFYVCCNKIIQNKEIIKKSYKYK
jgi:hypothetical protein